jgi:Flp pilus assembly protein TadG
MSPVIQSVSRRRRRGSVMVEFVMAGIVSLALMITTVQLSLAMWNYHTLAYAVHETNRYIIVHGRGCSMGVNTCTITVGNIVRKFESNSIGLNPSKVTLTLTPDNGSVQTCSPITVCGSSTVQWPPNTANWQNNYSTVRVAYSSSLGAVSMWYGSRFSRIGSFRFTSQSKLRILF